MRFSAFRRRRLDTIAAPPKQEKSADECESQTDGQTDDNAHVLVLHYVVNVGRMGRIFGRIAFIRMLRVCDDGDGVGQGSGAS